MLLMNRSKGECEVPEIVIVFVTEISERFFLALSLIQSIWISAFHSEITEIEKEQYFEVQNYWDNMLAG